MTLTAAERAYDFAMTTGRFYNELHAEESGLTVGILRDYLTGDTDCDYGYTPGNDLYDLYLRRVTEGHESQRHDYTAEELFIWAHEFDGQHL